MTSRTFLGLLLAAIGSGALLAPACLLPDFEVAEGDGPEGDAAPSVDGGGTLPDGAKIDPVPPSEGGACAAGTAECDGVAATVCETDLRMSQLHCGACGRGCGPAQCQAGECQSERLIGNLRMPVGLELAGPRMVWYEIDVIRGCRAVDCSASKAILADVNPGPNMVNGGLTPRQIAVVGQNFYFSHCPPNNLFDCAVAACDVAGCKLSGATYVTPPNGNRKAQLVVAGAGGIYSYQGLDGLYRTDLVQKTVTYANLIYKIGDQLQAFHIDPQRALWLDDNASQANPTGGLFACPPTGCPGAPLRLLPPPVRHLAVDKGVAYTSTGDNAVNASITACDVNGCGGAGTVLATNQPYVSDIAADGNAVYWTTLGAPNPVTNAAPVGAVMRCLLPSCAGGPTKIAEGLVNPISVRVDAGFVYWLTRGVEGQSTGQIERRRR